jgi:hypothetical protein
MRDTAERSTRVRQERERRHPWPDLNEQLMTADGARAYMLSHRSNEIERARTIERESYPVSWAWRNKH